jgi:hypothetical protein
MSAMSTMLYAYRVNTSISGPHEYTGCRKCRDHARYAAAGRGVSPLVRGEPFTVLGEVGMGQCDQCAYTDEATTRHERRNGLS